MTTYLLAHTLRNVIRCTVRWAYCAGTSLIGMS